MMIASHTDSFHKPGFFQTPHPRSSQHRRCVAVVCIYMHSSRPSNSNTSSVSDSHADSFHKPGFKLHARILHHLFTLVDSPTLKAALWDVGAKGPAAYPSNAAFVREHVVQLLTTNFPNMTALQVRTKPPQPLAPQRSKPLGGRMPHPPRLHQCGEPLQNTSVDPLHTHPMRTLPPPHPMQLTRPSRPWHRTPRASIT